jgi:hypothetical protein
MERDTWTKTSSRNTRRPREHRPVLSSLGLTLFLSTMMLLTVSHGTSAGAATARSLANNPLLRCGSSTSILFRASSLHSSGRSSVVPDQMIQAIPSIASSSDVGIPRLLAVSTTMATFAYGSSPNLHVVTVRRTGNSQWTFAGSGGCLVHVYRHGTWTADWTTAEPVSVASTSFTALVNVQTCGPPGAGGILPPTIEYSTRSIAITFYAKPLPTDVSYACAYVGTVAYKVRLKSPVGRRELLDGGQYPATLAMHRT